MTLSSTALLLTRCSGLPGSGQGASLSARDSVSGELSLDIVIVRLNLVKIFYFGLDPKNMFLTYLKTVFWVTDHFCIKLTF